MSSGLLSLSIHEALTLDGVEIAIHPDIFDSATTAAAPTNATTLLPPPNLTSSTHAQPNLQQLSATMTASSHSSPATPRSHKALTFGGTGQLTPLSLPNLLPPPLANVDTISSHSVLATGGESSNSDVLTQPMALSMTGSNVSHSNPSSTSRKLEVGSMIEVRVWDPKPHQQMAETPATSSSRNAHYQQQHHNNPLATTPPSSSHSAFRRVSPESSPNVNSSVQGAGDAAVSGSDNQSISSSTTGTTPSLHPKAADTMTLSPKTLTSDVAVTMTTSKPPLAPRRSSIIKNSSISNNVPARSIDAASPKRQHVRSISDMTMDTAMHEDMIIQHTDSDGGGATTNTAASTTSHLPAIPVGGIGVSSPGIGSTHSLGNISDHHQHSVRGFSQHHHTQNSYHSTTSKIVQTHNLRLSFVMLVGEKTLTSLKGSSRSQVSLLRPIADLYHLSPYDMVSIHLIHEEETQGVLEAISADYVTVSIKDQFISRGEMYLFQESLIGRWIYEGERLVSDKIKAHAREIRHGNTSVKSGIITSESKIAFRSRSARFVWLVQMSVEMWDYASSPTNPSCELYFDKFVQFMYKLFEKWAAMELSHSLTVVFFSRTIISNPTSTTTTSNGAGASFLGPRKPHLQKDVYGRYYEDHYKTIIENETRPDWESLVVRIKREFVKYPKELGWKEGVRRPSTASQGNLLEAINVTLNLLQFHYLDRDLHRTGNSILIVSPDCGVFEVDRGIAAISYQRMMDNGIGSDMLCLGLPPLHIAPFFLYNNDFHSIDKMGIDTSEVYFEVPHWINPSFLNYDSEWEENVTDNVSNLRGTETRRIEIAPNGFLVPNLNPLNGDRLVQTPNSQSKAFVLGKMPTATATNTTTLQTQQRQLISGRDFKDILEACRPRTSTYKLPSAMTYILKLCHGKVSEDGPTTAEGPDPKKYALPIQLKEWGTVDFGELDSFLLLNRSSRLGSSLGTYQGIEPADSKSDSDRSSIASSAASQASFLLGSRSIDRGPILIQPSLISRLNQTSKPEIDIRRSRSLDLEDDPFSHERQLSPSRNGRSFESLANVDSVNDKFKTDTDEIEFNEKHILDIMKRHDKFYAKTNRAIEPRQVDGSSTIEIPARDSSHNDDRSVHKGNQSDGGIGAALSQYNEKIQSAAAIPASKRLVSTGIIPTVASKPQFSPFGETGPRPMSPFMPMITMVPDSSDMLKQTRSQMHASAEIYSERTRLPMKGRLAKDSSGGEKPPEKPILLLGSGTKVQKVSDHSTSPSSVGRSPPRVGTALTSQKLANQMKIRQQQPPPISKKIRDSSSRYAARRKRACNPFRQQDEDEELKKKTHNSRRWSHVFPLGEVEFKRRAGPNWKSLCQPAILPLTIDYFPSPQELDDHKLFQTNPYQLTLEGMENCHYKSHRELLMEMVRQRVTQDYQIVPPSVLKASRLLGELSNKRGKTRGLGEQYSTKAESSSEEEVIQHTLSMGHRIHVLSYESLSDSINVRIYTAKNQDDPMNKVQYHYLLYSPITMTYRPMTQTFKKYSMMYRWNRLDHLLLDDDENALTDVMRCRCITFSLIPPNLSDANAEDEHVAKFRRLLEYLSKLKHDNSTPLDIEMNKSGDRSVESLFSNLQNRRIGTTEEMKRIRINLRRGKRDIYEWTEMALDKVFDTSRSYRITVRWLVASTMKVENQLQLLQRRCSQYGLELISVPQTSLSRDVFLNALSVPHFFCIRDKGLVEKTQRILFEKGWGFVDDGIHMTELTFLPCIERSKEFNFPVNRLRKLKNVACRQVILRTTGALFIRFVVDLKGWAILVVLVNSKAIATDLQKRDTTMKVIAKIDDFIKSAQSKAAILEKK